MKDSFPLLSDEGKEGVLLFHHELGGESMTDSAGDGRLGHVDGERSGHWLSRYRCTGAAFITG